MGLSDGGHVCVSDAQEQTEGEHHDSGHEEDGSYFVPQIFKLYLVFDIGTHDR